MTERRIERVVVPVKSGANECDMEVRHVAPEGRSLGDAAEERGVIIFNPGIGGGTPEVNELVAASIADQTGMAVASHSQTLARLIRGTNVFDTAVPAARETASRLVDNVFKRYRPELANNPPVNVAQSLGSLTFALTKSEFGDGVEQRLLIAPAFLSLDAHAFAEEPDLEGASLDEIVSAIPTAEPHWMRRAFRTATNFAVIGGRRELGTAMHNRDLGIFRATSSINREMAPAGPKQTLQAFAVLSLANVLPLVRETEHVVSGGRDPLVDADYLASVFGSRFHRIYEAGHDHPLTVSGAHTLTIALEEAGLADHPPQ